jgi:hypothetical protein
MQAGRWWFEPNVKPARRRVFVVRPCPTCPQSQPSTHPATQSETTAATQHAPAARPRALDARLFLPMTADDPINLAAALHPATTPTDGRARRPRAPEASHIGAETLHLPGVTIRLAQPGRNATGATAIDMRIGSMLMTLLSEKRKRRSGLRGGLRKRCVPGARKTEVGKGTVGGTEMIMGRHREAGHTAVVEEALAATTTTTGIPDRLHRDVQVRRSAAEFRTLAELCSSSSSRTLAYALSFALSFSAFIVALSVSSPTTCPSSSFSIVSYRS